MFRQDFTCPALLVATLVPPPVFRIRGYHPLWPDFPDRSARPMAKSCRLIRFRSPLLSESRLISVPLPTKMFQFSRFASLDLWIQSRMTLAGRVSPFGHLRIKARLPAPRSFSQATTSFIACDRQGIHHIEFHSNVVLCVACAHHPANPLPFDLPQEFHAVVGVLERRPE